MSDTRFTVVDSGLFSELAVRLARESSVPVNYFSEWVDEFPTLNDRAVGAGLENIVRIEDPLDPDVLDNTDIYVFPDIFNSGMQLMLERLGKPVWGSRKGDELETKRVFFRELQKQLGLPVPEYEVLNGLTELRDFLKDHGHCFVKTSSKIRGSMETWEHFDYEQSEYILDGLAVKFGGFKEHVVFLVEEPIEAPFETGFDTYCIDGRFPETPIQGIEVKGKLILCSAQIKSATPKYIDDAMTALSSILKERRYRNFISGEFREGILNDPCCRCPNPGIGVEMEMISNISEIIKAGANAELIEPEYEFEFGTQVAIFHDHHEEDWKQFRLPEELRRWVKLMEFACVDERWQIVPRPPHGQKVGWLLGVGNTIEKMAEHLHENAKALKNYPFDIKLDALEEAIKQAHEIEAEGHEFSDQPIPGPAEVVETQA